MVARWTLWEGGMLIKVMREMGRLLALLWAERALCESGRDLELGGRARAV
jgi:hypothetical protein